MVALQNYTYCSGILPYCYFNQSLFFLLGKSKRNNRLITFSGKNDEHEEDPRETASREGYEETLGCLMARASILERVKQCSDTRILLSKTPRGMPCYTYLIEIPFRKHYSTSFGNTREFLSTMGIKVVAFQEMVDIKWICAHTMFTKIRKTWERSGMLCSDAEWQKILSLAKTQQTELWRHVNESDNDDDDINNIALTAAMPPRTPPPKQLYPKTN